MGLVSVLIKEFVEQPATPGLLNTILEKNIAGSTNELKPLYFHKYILIYIRKFK